MKKLIKSFFLLIAIALVAFTFNFNDNQSNTALNPEPPGFHVSVISGTGYTIKCYSGDTQVGECYTGGGNYCNINLSSYGQGYYNLTADNGSCQGGLNNEYWNGLGTKYVTIDTRSGCYKKLLKYGQNS